MHAISNYRGNRPTHTQTGPITIHYAAASAQCNMRNSQTNTLKFTTAVCVAPWNRSQTLATSLHLAVLRLDQRERTLSAGWTTSSAYPANGGSSANERTRADSLYRAPVFLSEDPNATLYPSGNSLPSRGVRSLNFDTDNVLYHGSQLPAADASDEECSELETPTKQKS